MSIRRFFLWIAYRLALIYWFIFRPAVTGSYVAVWHQDDLLMVENSYRAGWTFPSGGKRRDETYKAAAIREMWEEVRIKASVDELVETQFFSTTIEFRDDRSVVFEFHPEQRPEYVVDGFEIAAASWMPFETLRSTDLLLAPIVRQYIEWKHQQLRIR